MTSDPFRVLQVVTIMNRGGLETFIMNMYRNIDRNKVQFDFLLHRQEPGAYDEEIKKLGGRLYYVPRANPFNPNYYRALDSFFNDHPYKIVHSHIDCMSAFPLAAAKRHGAVMRVAHSHNSCQDRDFKYPLKLMCKRFINRYATDLFACSNEAGKWMFGTNDFTIVKNAIDVSSFSFSANTRKELRGELGIENNFVVGHVGRFEPVKNHIFLIRVFEKVLERRADAHLLLVGDGGLINHAKQTVLELGLQDNVTFLGVRNDVNRLMQAMDTFVMPSLYEGLPLVMVEAQASGLPCIISSSMPCDCDISCSVRRVSLDEDLSIWVDAVLGCAESNRKAASEEVRRAGFDAITNARAIQSFYLNCIH